MALSSDEQLALILRRLDEMERRIARLEPQPRAAITPEPAPAEVPIEAPVDIPLPAQEQALESKFGLTLLNRIGVVTLILGVAFFFKWAADNDWIGPLGRVLLGVLASAAAASAADWMWRRGQQVFAQGITGTGVAILYISLYAAFDFYHLLPQAPAFALMWATTGLAVILALRYGSAAIAALGFAGAYVIPLLLSDGRDRPWFLILYLLAINFAATRLATAKHWQRLEVLSAAATAIIFGAWVAGRGGQLENHWPTTFGLAAFLAQRFFTSWPALFLITQPLCATGAYLVWPHAEQFGWLLLLFAAVGLAFAYRRAYPIAAAVSFAAFWPLMELWLWRQDMPRYLKPVEVLGFLLFCVWIWLVRESPKARDLALFALNGVCFVGVAYQALDADYQKWLALLIWLVAIAYLGFGMYCQRVKNAAPSLIPLALGMAAAFLTLAIAVQFSGFTTTIGWAIQAAAFVWIGVRLNSPRTIAAATAVFALAFLAAMLVDAWSYEDFAAHPALFNARFMTFAILAAALLLSAYWLSTAHRTLALIHFSAGHIALLTGLTLEVIAWARRSSRPADLLSRETISISVLFALYAIALVALGVVGRSLVHRLAGLLLTAIVILKLYFFDVWQLNRIFQIAAFVILGVLLLSTSFLYSRFKDVIGGWRREA